MSESRQHRALREHQELEACCSHALATDAAEKQWRDSEAGRESLRRFREQPQFLVDMGADEGYEDMVRE